MASSRRALLATALATAGTVATAGSAVALQPNPDAEIIALSDTFLAELEESDRLSSLEDELSDTAEDQRRKRQIEARQEVLSSEHWRMRVRLARLRATSPAGLQAKARAARTYGNCFDGMPDDDDVSLLWSPANDVAGIPSKFAEEEDDEDAGVTGVSSVAAAVGCPTTYARLVPIAGDDTVTTPEPAKMAAVVSVPGYRGPGLYALKMLCGGPVEVFRCEDTSWGWIVLKCDRRGAVWGGGRLSRLHSALSDRSWPYATSWSQRCLSSRPDLRLTN